MGKPEVRVDYINVVEKVWGRELWLVNNERYCSKILEISSGGYSSLHYHRVKDETFYILEGSCCLEIEGTIFTLNKGHSVRILPTQIHSFWCSPDNVGGCTVLEM